MSLSCNINVTLDFKTVDDTSLGVVGHGLGSQEQELVLQNGREDSNKQSESSMHPSWHFGRL